MQAPNKRRSLQVTIPSRLDIPRLCAWSCRHTISVCTVVWRCEPAFGGARPLLGIDEPKRKYWSTESRRNSFQGLEPADHGTKANQKRARAGGLKWRDTLPGQPPTSEDLQTAPHQSSILLPGVKLAGGGCFTPSCNIYCRTSDLAILSSLFLQYQNQPRLNLKQNKNQLPVVGAKRDLFYFQSPQESPLLFSCSRPALPLPCP